MILVNRFRLEGHSMEPSLKNGDEIVATNIFYLFKKPKINDIVVIKRNSKI